MRSSPWRTGRITQVRPAPAVRPQLPLGMRVMDYEQDTLIMAGFIDCHVHFPQTQIIGAAGEQLLD